MAKGITCTCGHSWNKSDSSKKDMNVCHICGKDNTMKNGGLLDELKPGGKVDKSSGYIDITKQYGIPQFTEAYLNKAMELNKQYPGSKFVCTANGCADIASQAAEGMGHNFGKANAWEYGNRSDVVFTNPAYAKELQNVTGPLHNPISYDVPKEFLGMQNVLVGLNRKDNLLDAKGNKLPNVSGAEQMGAALTREQANDSKDYANQQLYKGSRGYEHVGYMMGNNTLLHGTGASKDHPAFFVLDDISNGIDLAGYGKYEPVEAIAEPTMMQSVGNKIKSLGNTASEMVFGKPTSKKADPQTISAVAKKKNGGWLDKYNDGGPVQPNYNNASVSYPPNFVGDGYDTTGRNYSPAWGGQFQDGGTLKDNAERALALGSIATPFPLNYGLSLAGSAIDLYDAYNAKNPHDRNVQLTEAVLGAIPYGRIVKGMKLGTDAYKAYKALKPIAAINSVIDVKDTVDPNLKYAMGGALPGATGMMYARYEDGGDLSFLNPKLRNMLEGYKPGLMDAVGDYRLPEGYAPPFKDPSSEISTSIGGEDGEPAYLIPTFKYGQRLNNPVSEFNMTGQHIGGPFKTVEDVERFGELRHQYVGDGKTLPSPIATSNMAMGGSMPGAAGFMYARTGSIPSNGKYAKKTKASAQNGTKMEYYQNGLDWKPKSISRDGSNIIKDDMGQWNHPGEITEIGSNQITMQGVPYPVLGISDTGDTQMMYPDEEYQYDGESVTEYPMMKEGGALQLVKLDQLTNFTNYNTKQPGQNWLDKYQ